MALSQNLISQFVKATNDQSDTKSESTLYGKMTDETHVQLDGSDRATPVSTTVAAETGDRVSVLIKDHTATVTGNLTAPAAKDSEVKKNKEDADKTKSDLEETNKTVSDLSDSISSINSSVDLQNSTISAINSKVDLQNSSITAINSKVDLQNSSITALNSRVDLQDSNIQSINSNITTINSNIGTLNSNIGIINSELWTDTSKIGVSDSILHIVASELWTDTSKIGTADSLVTTIASELWTDTSKIGVTDSLIHTVASELWTDTSKIGVEDSVLTTVKSSVDVYNSSFQITDGVVTGIKGIDTEWITTKELTADHATIQNLDATYATIENLNATNATIENLSATYATIENLNATNATIDNLDAKYATIANLDATNANVTNLTGKYATFEKTVTDELVTAKGWMLEGAIGDAQISDLSATKLTAGTIDTSQITIAAKDSTVEISGNQILVNDTSDATNIQNRVILGKYSNTDDEIVYGLLVRSEDGQTAMIDGEGVHNAGITDGAINNNKVADDANISGTKLDINSVVTCINNGTTTISGTKVMVGDKTLEVALSEIEQTADPDGIRETLSQHETAINANTEAIKLKVSTQTFESYQTTVTSDISDAKSEAISTAASDATTKANNAKSEAISTAASDATSKANNAKSEAISTAASDATTKADQALADAKSYTSGEITTVNKHLTTIDSSITTMQESISLKVEQTDIDSAVSTVKKYTDDAKSSAISTAASDATSKANNALSSAKTYADNAVDNLEIGGRNLLLDSKTGIYNTGSTVNSDGFAEGYTTGTGSSWNEVYLALSAVYSDTDLYGKEVTISGYVKFASTSTTGCYFGIGCFSSKSGNRCVNRGSSLDLSMDLSGFLLDDGSALGTTVTANIWYKVHKTLTWSIQATSTYKYHAFQIKTAKEYGAYNFYYKQLKVELGNKPTDWTPAPEDTDSAIESATTTITQQYTSAINLAKNSITSTVSETYATKTELSTTDGNVSSLTTRVTSAEQKITKDGIISTVGDYYATDDALDALSAIASKSYSFTGASGSVQWIKLGTLVSAGDASNFIISVYTGNGYNAGSSQNSRATIVIKDGWQSSQAAASSFGVSVTRENCETMTVKVLASAHNTCDVWVYLPWTYWNGNYTISGNYTTWTHSGSHQTDEPTSGTSQDVAYRTNAEGALSYAQTQISQLDTSISLKVSKDGVISAINQSAEAITIDASKITLTASNLVSIINSGTTKISASNLELTASNLVNIINSGTTKINTARLNLTASDVVNLINSGSTTISASKLNLTSSDVISLINSGTTTISAARLNLSGYITATDLQTSGSTKINGSNITTGTISANLISGATTNSTAASLGNWKIWGDGFYHYTGSSNDYGYSHTGINIEDFKVSGGGMSCTSVNATTFTVGGNTVYRGSGAPTSDTNANHYGSYVDVVSVGAASSWSNLPSNKGSYGHLLCFANSSYCTQIYINNAGTPYLRSYFGSSWTSWVAI